MHRNSMNHFSLLGSTQHQSIDTAEGQVFPKRVVRRPRPPGTHVTNPLRIGRIGADRIDVFIRPVHGGTELLALVDRLEELLDAGYETVNVLFEPTPSEPDTGTLTDANTPPPARV